MKKTLGGDRLGSGSRMQIEMHNYERSTHDMGYLWRSTMSAGTLVPFMVEVALPGDTFDIKLHCDIKTHPTVGPLFGSFKVQLDTFLAPIRLYQAKLHNNKLGIGLNMSEIKLPIIPLNGEYVDFNAPPDGIDMDNYQINPSCILSYLGIRGVGAGYQTGGGGPADNFRDFNAIPILTYWDIYKNYYANKQEEVGAVIHTPAASGITDVASITINGNALAQAPTVDNESLTFGSTIVITLTAGTQDFNQVLIKTIHFGALSIVQIADLISTVGLVTTWKYKITWNTTALNWDYGVTAQQPINIEFFPLSEIDDMREYLLAQVATAGAVNILTPALQPYIKLAGESAFLKSKAQAQEGLGIKTYQSDIYNNWIQTAWIDGANGINAVTAIDTSGGSFTIDTLNLSKKVYDMLNRIAVSGGTYDDWLDAVYTHDRYTKCETPMYMGGLIKELVFQEVVSNAEASGDETGAQPLGTLAGKGVMGNKHKGGNVTIKVDEPSYVIGIVSITPRLDYSQGNRWDTSLKTIDDFHKPALDEIGFQELITEGMAWWDTYQDVTGVWKTRSAGKQPAWINYMTNVNRVYGNFAIQNNEMFMTLNRRYTPTQVDQWSNTIDDLTTYIDPAKFNNIFAETALDAQNFWTQISVDITARRKMSAKLMPNL